MKIKKRGQLQISFGWMFAIITGIFILFLAIYGAARLLNIEQTASDAQVANQIGILLNPLETGFESGLKTSMTLPSETRIINRCNNNGIFGRQTIRVSQKSFNEWTNTGIDAGFSNKYIFSANYSEGKRFVVFSKPFGFPFKVADLIFITSDKEKYCFINPREGIKNEIQNLNIENFETENCSPDSVRVCFNGKGNDCDVKVDEIFGKVEKNNEDVFFEGDALMYAAILSDKETYECQVKRLMQRTGELSKIYIDKASIVSRSGCNSGVKEELLSLGSGANRFSSSQDLFFMQEIADNLGENNKNSGCKLW